jgi:hypothetical protein
VETDQSEMAFAWIMVIVVPDLAFVVLRLSTAQQPLLPLLLKPVEHAETGHVEMASAPMVLAVQNLAGVVLRPITAQRLPLKL